MKAFILAAGKGTRLKPWTDSHPKALVEVGGIPMLQRIVENLYQKGITEIAVNTFHFAEQVIEFIKTKGWKVRIFDERPNLLETGGAILNAEEFFTGDEPVLVHNVDILSNADLSLLESRHKQRGALASLLVSDRQSSRKLTFSENMRLNGWYNIGTRESVKLECECKNLDPDLDAWRSEKGITMDTDILPEEQKQFDLAFSGIYMVSPDLVKEMKFRGWHDAFPIMDFFLKNMGDLKFYGVEQPGLEIIDIGKPDSLNRANQMLSK